MTSESCLDHAKATFLDSTAGKLYSLYHTASLPCKNNKVILVIPPFAEEMNKSRKMITLLAERFKCHKTNTMVFDLYGTGDSEGNFVSAKWGIWLDDIANAIAWLKGQGAGEIGLLGIRLGAMLALDYAEKAEDVDRLIFWQPVVNGGVMMAQFLRLRLAANIFGGNEAKETTADLRRQLQKDNSIEIAGYDLSLDLFQAIDKLKLQDLRNNYSGPVDWVELVPGEGGTLSRAGQRVINSWLKQGYPTESHMVIGEPFWSLPEITIATQLLDKTVEIVI